MTSFFLLGPSYFFSVFEDTFILFSYFCLAIKDLEDSGVLSGLKLIFLSLVLFVFCAPSSLLQKYGNCGADSIPFYSDTEETFCFAGRKI